MQAPCPPLYTTCTSVQKKKVTNVSAVIHMCAGWVHLPFITKLQLFLCSGACKYIFQ